MLEYGILKLDQVKPTIYEVFWNYLRVRADASVLVAILLQRAPQVCPTKTRAGKKHYIAKQHQTSRRRGKEQRSNRAKDDCTSEHGSSESKDQNVRC